jgi:hypothetical protein
MLQWRFAGSDQAERRIGFTTHFLLVQPARDLDWNRP